MNETTNPTTLNPLEAAKLAAQEARAAWEAAPTHAQGWAVAYVPSLLSAVDSLVSLVEALEPRLREVLDELGIPSNPEAGQ